MYDEILKLALQHGVTNTFKGAVRHGKTPEVATSPEQSKD